MLWIDFWRICGSHSYIMFLYFTFQCVSWRTHPWLHSCLAWKEVGGWSTSLPFWRHLSSSLMWVMDQIPVFSMTYSSFLQWGKKTREKNNSTEWSLQSQCSFLLPLGVATITNLSFVLLICIMNLCISVLPAIRLPLSEKRTEDL